MSQEESSLKEAARLEATLSYGLIDAKSVGLFDELVRRAAQIFNAPMASLGLMDSGVLHLISKVGWSGKSIPRSGTFCSHTIAYTGMTVIEDASTDPRFRNNPFVAGEPFIRFYAGVPLRSVNHFAIGAFCVINTIPSTADADQCRALADLAVLAMTGMTLHRAGRSLRELQNTRASATQHPDK